MKKTAIVGLLALCAAGAYAQGTINFSDYFVQGLNSQIYSPNTAAPTVSTQGNTATQSPAGAATYANSVPIGGSTGPGTAAASANNWGYGNNFTVQLYYGAGFNVALAALQPSTAYIGTMSTGTSSPTAGYFQAANVPSDGLIGTTTTMNDINNTGTLDNKATLALACWYNANGTITSLAQAQTINGEYWGESTKFNQNNLGESSAIETAFNGSATAAQQAATPSFTSFSLVQNVPEPSTIALGVLGACAFLARRKK